MTAPTEAGARNQYTIARQPWMDIHDFSVACTRKAQKIAMTPGVDRRIAKKELAKSILSQRKDGEILLGICARCSMWIAGAQP